MPTKLKVKLTKHDDGSGDHTINGYFHRWGDKPYAKEDGDAFPVTYGIVELEDGIVKQIPPFRIKFVEVF
jgi:hypothetical protein